LNIDDARRAVDRFVTQYNTTRLHSALGYVTPLDMLEGRQKSILEERDRKLEEARHLRGEKRRPEKLEMPKKLPATLRVSGVDSAVRLEDRARLGSAPKAFDGRCRQKSTDTDAGPGPASLRQLLMAKCSKSWGVGGWLTITREKVPLFDNISKRFQPRQTLSPGKPGQDRVTIDAIAGPCQLHSFFILLFHTADSMHCPFVSPHRSPLNYDRS
jgi:hypothetical protein